MQNPSEEKELVLFDVPLEEMQKRIEKMGAVIKHGLSGRVLSQEASILVFQSGDKIIVGVSIITIEADTLSVALDQLEDSIMQRVSSAITQAQGSDPSSH